MFDIFYIFDTLDNQTTATFAQPSPHDAKESTRLLALVLILTSGACDHNGQVTAWQMASKAFQMSLFTIYITQSLSPD